MKYEAEVGFIVEKIKEGYELFCSDGPKSIMQKSRFDLVTEIDNNIEKFISTEIKKRFPGDNILGEETSSEAGIAGRTWTIDPIDGTVNMASGIKLFGIQCSMIENGDIVVAAIYLPHFGETVTAVKGGGCFLNGKRTCVNKDFSVNNAIVSFGDYPHKSTSRVADLQHDAIRKLYSRIAKIRMFGAACIDFAFVATGRTEGTVVITNNLWDIAPGILICREAGGRVLDLNGRDYRLGNEGVIVGADEKTARMIADSFRHRKTVNALKPDKEYEGVIFDCDGVVLDTEKYHLAAWNKALERHGIAAMTEEEYFPFRSRGRAEILGALTEKRGLELTDEEKSGILSEKGKYYEDQIRALSEKDVVKGVRRYLEALSADHVKIALATSSKAAADQLRALDLFGYFEFVVDGSSDLPKKPAPDIYLYLLTKMRISADECLVFEDSPAGIESAVRAGCDVVCVGNVSSDRAGSRIVDFEEMA